ncbi:unnamed protein product [Rangifer tarandus platyrhynchus]|uniref:Uncharacterized protein n=1 Tax=Rangifer tarandus platyrhynchus TaxID=3082113 RepID=A0ABN8ZAS8_RANTA|nr:unnamed protein product [Rangifer tarandus platyrhynchus]
MLNGVCGQLASVLWGTTPLPPIITNSVPPPQVSPLRYEASTNELINEDLGIACSIIDGIPNMIQQAARMTHQNKKQEEMEH